MPTRKPALAMALIAFALAVVLAGTTLPTALYPLYEKQFTLAPVLTPIIFATYAAGVILALLFLGYLSDQIGRRRTMIPALILSGVSAVVFLFAQGLAALLVGRVLSGLSSGIATGAATAWIVDTAGKDKAEPATMLAVGANLGGLACGPLLGGLLARFAPEPLRLVYLVHLAALIPAAAALFAAPETVNVEHPKVRLRLQKMDVPAKARASFTRAAVSGICAFAVAGVFTAVAPAFLGKGLHEKSPALAGMLVSLFFISAALGQLAVSSLDKRKGLALGCVVLVAGLGLLAAALLLKSVVLLFVSGGVSGLGQGLSVGFGLADINQQVGKKRAETDSSYFVLLYLGVAVPTIGVGFLVTGLGMVTAGLIFCGLVAAGAVGVLVAVAAGKKNG